MQQYRLYTTGFFILLFLVLPISAIQTGEQALGPDTLQINHRNNSEISLIEPHITDNISRYIIPAVQSGKIRMSAAVPETTYTQKTQELNLSDQYPELSVRTYWIDPVKGNDKNTGITRTSPLRTLIAAWNRIPKNKVLKTGGYKIMMLPGDYYPAHIPEYMSGVYGSPASTIIIQSVKGRHSVRIHTPMEITTCRYLSLVNLDLITDSGSSGGGNVLHISASDHILVKGCTLNGKAGGERLAQETLKANQVRYLNVEGCDISGAFWYPLDYVAVQDGNITGSKIHDAGEFCMVIKGGSSRIRVEQNQIYNGNAGAISAGSGTGFNWMVSPYIHYEMYDSKFVNNIIRKTGTTGISVNGGYNILIAYNTLYKTGTRDHLLEVMRGSRSCDGDTPTCEKYRRAGGWGTTGEGQYIPSAHVYIYNNIFFNPSGYQSKWNQFVVQGPDTPPAGSNVPSPSFADRDIRIKGNLIWNGPPVSPALPLFGEEGGCPAANPTCNKNIVIASNRINTIVPQFISPDTGNFTPKKNGTLSRVSSTSIPAFSGRDRPQPPLAPGGDLVNTIPTDYFKKIRTVSSPPGAVI